MSPSQEERPVGIKLNQPFAAAVEKLRRDALSRTDYDPAQIFAWGQMMAVSLLEMLKAVETRFGREGQQTCTDALVEVGRRLALEGLEGVQVPDDVSPIEAISRFATWVNEQLYASIEKPSIDGPDACSFDILWCPHQDVRRSLRLPRPALPRRRTHTGGAREARRRFRGVRRRLRQHDAGGRCHLSLPDVAGERERRGRLDCLLARAGGEGAHGAPR